MRAAGRTDTGVHAIGQIVAIDLPTTSLDEDNNIPEWQILKAINSRLPDDISVSHVEPCRPTFEPRLEATRKRYSYTLRYRRKVRDAISGKELGLCANGGVHTIRNALDSPVLWLCPWSLEDSNLQHLCKAMEGEHDFAAFCHKDDRRAGKANNVMVLEKFEARVIQPLPSSSFVGDNGDQKDSPNLVVTVQLIMEAKGFRRGMCRNLVGFVVDVCRGQILGNDIEDILENMWSGSDEAAKLVHAAPASGLCLEQVWF
jgi:tRNA pseudouridine38-40 synthase